MKNGFDYDRSNCLINESYWLDDQTYYYEFGRFTDKDGDDFIVAVEYHEDNDTWYFDRCYDNQVITIEDMSETQTNEIKTDMRKWMECDLK